MRPQSKGIRIEGPIFYSFPDIHIKVERPPAVSYLSVTLPEKKKKKKPSLRLKHANTRFLKSQASKPSTGWTFLISRKVLHRLQTQIIVINH